MEDLLVLGCAGSSLPHGDFSLVAVGAGLLTAAASLHNLRSTGSRAQGLPQLQLAGSGVVLPGSETQAQQLRHAGLVAPRRVGSSQIRDRNSAPYTGRQIPYH